ncbi:MAG: hypothetical protein PHI12_11055 [Dehalococcoidales bacterium]|nr:hypothetical protein [Dehalococcoidales bacterium]
MDWEVREMREVIEIPFRKLMIERLFEGRKVCTWRSKVYGDPRQVFEVERDNIKKSFEILGVVPMRAGYVARYLHRPEGFDSEEEWIGFVARLRRGHRLDLDQWGYTHFFAEL